MKDSKRIVRRRHSAEVKAQVLSECAQRGASVAGVALSHGINANVVHKWRRLAGAVPLPVASFVPVALPASTCAASADIRMELRRGAISMTITWPAAAAGDCAAWMRADPFMGARMLRDHLDRQGVHAGRRHISSKRPAATS